ncbi:HU family DNA-binding protein [Teredinibacter sp. KSP-S5-2]|uniref:HU family DNA-binding protein n=1 Tax=Teredinibacter sp. KSP-S5-2 TaxID=3034506 RepID=UPI002934DD25|nr:HU family DNA-binding protein [Teredinibacter sp. KSP-S5-2]WNO09275.1 HU family DNA-binding protein [Teredinibacter sp. KSP-S5-2]
MHKTELVAVVAEYLGISHRESDNIIASTLEHMTDALARGESVNLIGFGAFSVKSRAERKGRNPKTGEDITIAAHNQVVFKPGKALKEIVQPA